MEQDAFALIRLAQAGDEGACARLVEENSPLVWSVARRFFGRGVDPEDLYQLGCVGFLKAVRGFDTGFGTRFSTYAVPKISGEIRRFLRDDGAIKVSRSVKEQAAQIRSDIVHKCHRYLDDLGRASTEEKEALADEHKQYSEFCDDLEMENNFIDELVARVMELPEREL